MRDFRQVCKFRIGDVVNYKLNSGEILEGTVLETYLSGDYGIPTHVVDFGSYKMRLNDTDILKRVLS